MNKLHKRHFSTSYTFFAFVIISACQTQTKNTSTVKREQQPVLDITEGFVQIKAQSNQECLHLSGASTEDAVAFSLAPCDYINNQTFSIQSSDAHPEEYEVKVLHSLKCVDVRGNSTDAGADIIQYYCHGENNQKWYFHDMGGNSYSIISKSSGLCIEAQSNPEGSIEIIQNACNMNNLDQLWQVDVAMSEPGLFEEDRLAECKASKGENGIPWAQCCGTGKIMSCYNHDNPFPVCVEDQTGACWPNSASVNSTAGHSSNNTGNSSSASKTVLPTPTKPTPLNPNPKFVPPPSGDEPVPVVAPQCYRSLRNLNRCCGNNAIRICEERNSTWSLKCVVAPPRVLRTLGCII